MHIAQSWVDLGDLLILAAVLGGATIFLAGFGWHELHQRYRPDRSARAVPRADNSH